MRRTLTLVFCLFMVVGAAGPAMAAPGDDAPVDGGVEYGEQVTVDSDGTVYARKGSGSSATSYFVGIASDGTEVFNKTINTSGRTTIAPLLGPDEERVYVQQWDGSYPNGRVTGYYTENGTQFFQTTAAFDEAPRVPMYAVGDEGNLYIRNDDFDAEHFDKVAPNGTVLATVSGPPYGQYDGALNTEPVVYNGSVFTAYRAETNVTLLEWDMESETLKEHAEITGTISSTSSVYHWGPALKNDSFAVFGSYAGSGAYGVGVSLADTGANSVVEWNKSIGGDFNPGGRGVLASGSGFYAVLGSGGDANLTKYNWDGSVAWSQGAWWASYAGGQSPALTGDGTIIHSNISSTNKVVARDPTDGSVVWESGALSARAEAITVSPNGGVYYPLKSTSSPIYASNTSDFAPDGDYLTIRSAMDRHGMAPSSGGMDPTNITDPANATFLNTTVGQAYGIYYTAVDDPKNLTVSDPVGNSTMTQLEFSRDDGSNSTVLWVEEERAIPGNLSLADTTVTLNNKSLDYTLVTSNNTSYFRFTVNDWSNNTVTFAEQNESSETTPTGGGGTTATILGLPSPIGSLGGIPLWIFGLLFVGSIGTAYWYTSQEDVNWEQ